MDDYIFGANILENLTTGMYKDSKVIYREYIQNACDQIDKAVKMGILQQNEGKIQIFLENNRTISIEDNATGISAEEFQSILGNIANSDKKIGEDKGFRGIGRLCGLAYCRELVFTTSYKGENIISVMRCDAKKMRQMIEKSERGEKYTASDVLNSIYQFSRQSTDDVQGHWFKVEMIDINKENTDLLDFNQIKEYLSFVAPVPYQNTFIFRSEIQKYADKNGYKIDVYNIYLNGESVVKKYKTNFKTSKGDDEIFEVVFKEFKDTDNHLLAWMWVGVSTFKAVISKDCQMRGLRLRKENIQIGSDDALQKLFKEDRGNHYFVGEVFAVSKDLIPNSQRDYFNENATRLSFERTLKEYFNEELKKVYYDSSVINSSYNKIKGYEKDKDSFEQKQANGDYVDEGHLKAAAEKIEKSRREAEEARRKIEKNKIKAEDENNSIIAKVISRIENEHKPVGEIFIDKPNINTLPKQKKKQHRTDRLSAYNKNERKLISKIFSIIVKATDEDTAETIIGKIEEEL